MVQSERITRLNDSNEKNGDYVLYWMQSSQRAEGNRALQLAIEKANLENLPVVTYFGVTEDFPGANLRHYKFMVEGLKETKRELNEMGIKLVIGYPNLLEGVIKLAPQASVLVVDRGYLRIEKEWRKQVSSTVDTEMFQVEDNLVVPVEEASKKEEYAAYTFRPKVRDRLEDFLSPIEDNKPDTSSRKLNLALESINLNCLLDQLTVDRTVRPVSSYTGGTQEAKRLLKDFIDGKLDRFAEKRNDPSEDYLSHMSPYLHFGQISPIYIANKVIAAESPGQDAYLEELVVRRELSVNFVHYNRGYDDLSSVLPEWALATLAEHKNDKREYLYSKEELERAQTHDPYWNACQKEMIFTGKMHGYMRMYWGKKILEWTPDPETGFETTLFLNNRYELDGRDPNGFAGVGWCYGKHDRAWKERKVFGKVRYMNSRGLERKFDIESYCEKIEQMEVELGDFAE